MLPLRLLSAVFLVACAVRAALDPYLVLGLAKDADERSIKSAYRQLLKQYHPDKNNSPEAHDKFIEIGEAYDILSDPQKKSNYDRFGDPKGQSGPGLGDMFNQFFGGQQARGPRRGLDTQVNVAVPLRDFVVGKEVEFDVEMSDLCDTCNALGSADGKRKQCSLCNGSGFITVRRQMGMMVHQMQQACHQCGGKGLVIAKVCKKCLGKGTVRNMRHIKVDLLPGTPRNHVSTLEGKGDQHPDLAPGNMNVRFVEDSAGNWGFRRVNDNLYRTEVLSAREARLGGWLREVPLFDDEAVTLLRKKGDVVIDGQVDEIKGHGMPMLDDDGEYGTLYVQYRVLPLGKREDKDEL